MALSDRQYNRPFLNIRFRNGVKLLLVANFAIYVLYFFANLSGYGSFFEPFGLTTREFLHGALWQPVTYLFLHDPFSFWHILFNMLALWMFGKELESDYGTDWFLKYYFICGVGAGICVIIANLLFSSTLSSRTIGASGAIYGLMLAYGSLYPDRIVLFSFLFPIKAKYFVMILGGIAFLSTFASTGGGVSHVAHLGGMIFGYFYLKSARGRKHAVSLLGSAQGWWRDYKIRRARKKFDVYLKRRQSDHDHTIH